MFWWKKQGLCGLMIELFFAKEHGMNSFQQMRKNMVDGQIHPAGVIDPRVLENFESVPREEFVPSDLAGRLIRMRIWCYPMGGFC